MANTTTSERQETLRSISNTVSETASQLADKASARVGDAIQSVEATASAATESGREAAQSVQKVAGNLRGAVDKSLKDQPMATLAVAALTGFVIGALWKT